MDMIRILLTGASGCVGTAVRQLAAGHPKIELHPTARSLRPESANYPWIRCNLAELPKHLPDRIDACIHAAALVHRRDVSEHEFREVNFDQTIRLAEALAKRPGFRRFVFVSTIAASDEAPERTAYGQWKRAAEEELTRLGERLDFEAVSVRLATVYGKYDRGNIAQLHDAIRARRYVRLAPAQTLKSLVAVEHAADALLWAATCGDRLPQVSTVVDAPPVPLAEIENALAWAADVKPPPRLPYPVGWAIAAVGSVLAVAGVKVPLDLRRLRTLSQPVAHCASPWYQACDRKPGDLAVAFRKAYGERAAERASNSAQTAIEMASDSRSRFGQAKRNQDQ